MVKSNRKLGTHNLRVRLKTPNDLSATKTRRTKIVDGKLYELHPTKGWQKQRRTL